MMTSARMAPRAFGLPSFLSPSTHVRMYSISHAMSEKPRVVVLGCGWGGFAFAKGLDPKKFDITIVSPRNHMLFTPLLASTSVGTLDFRSIAEPVRASLPHVALEQGKCRGIDPVAKTIDIVAHYGVVRGGSAEEANPGTKRLHTLKYDALVIAVGARNNTFGIPGVEEHVMFLKELSDARRIRTTLTQNIEAAAFPGIPDEERKRLCSFVVVGGGPTGVEFAAELHDFITQDIKRMYPSLIPHIAIKLIEGREILSSFDVELREWAKRRLQVEGVEIVTGASVNKVDPSVVHLSDGRSYPFSVCVWSTGVAPRKVDLPSHPLLSSSIAHLFPVTTLVDPHVFGKDKGGRLITDAYLRVQAPPATASEPPHAPLDGVFALGDCANVGGKNHPATAQVAEQQGNYLASIFNTSGLPSFASAPSTPFVYKHKGSLAYLGEYGAVSDFTQVQSETGGPTAPLAGKKLKGILSWLVWRSAYLTKLGSWRNRLQVPVDWARTMLFGRDISNF